MSVEYLSIIGNEKGGSDAPCATYSTVTLSRHRLYILMRRDECHNTTQVELDRVTHQGDFLYMLSVLLVLPQYGDVTVVK